MDHAEFSHEIKNNKLIYLKNREGLAWRVIKPNPALNSIPSSTQDLGRMTISPSPPNLV